MRPLTLSINPTYLCNFRCDFCYLTEEQLSSKKSLDLANLEFRLKEIKNQDIRVTHVDLYGGEIGLLGPEYLNDLISLIKRYFDCTFNIVTNLSKINPIFLNPDIELTVSFDFEAREKHELVFQNILKLPRPISILLLASPKLLELNVSNMISIFNSVANIVSVEIKPYSKNQSNQLNSNFSDFEEFVKKWLLSAIPKRFQFINEDLILDSLEQNRNAFSDDHLYITPEGQFAVLEFDTMDNEFFLTLDSTKAYFDWSNREKEMVKANSFCQKCKYLGRCLTEHYRNVKSIDRSCNGFVKLLDWSENHFGSNHPEQNSSTAF